MYFGPIPAREAAGCILGHSLSLGKQRFRKGRLLSLEDVAALAQAGHDPVYAARLGPEDVTEDSAANRIAAAAAGPGTRAATAFTGRANIYAESAGLALVDTAQVDRLNLLDEAVTIATVAPFELVEPGQMLATVKIIPFAAPADAVAAAEALAGGQDDAGTPHGPLVRLAPLRHCRAGLVMTRVADTKPSVLDKTEAAVRERLERLGSSLQASRICTHDTGAIAAAIAELTALDCAPILVFGATAIVDRADVVPAGIEAAGGVVEHFGMPVDPGNLLLTGRLGERPVVGVPGCARSPKLNGFDWVLQRLCAGLRVTRADIMRMGAGGLLKEIPTRPMPRQGGNAGDKPGALPAADAAPRRPKVAALILAGGLSSRMQGGNKLLADLEGKPILRHVVEHVLASPADPVLVVTGHRTEEVRQAAGPGRHSFVYNPDFAAGLSTSLVAGVNALPPGLDGVLVCLGDMPDVPPEVLDKLISAFNPVEGRAICIPVIGAKRGNPMLWGAQFFNQIKTLRGDSGARKLLAEQADWICEVPCSAEGVLNDIDTSEALAARRQR